MIMERKIGEIFNIDNEWYQVVKSNGEWCKGCAFYEKGCKAKYADVGNCGTSREDWTQVIFKKLEKVGEPLKIHNRLVLKVKADAYKCMRCCFYSKGKCELTMQECEHYDCGEENKFIEIKETKEDMEEKKLKLNPFDLEAAKAGKPVCTRDGHKVRIICFDKREGLPIVALVETKVNSRISEEVALFDIDGRAVTSDIDSKLDLMMLSKKKEGWVNIYKSDNGTYYTGAIFYEKNDALVNTAEIKITTGIPIDCIDTVKINWEE